MYCSCLLLATIQGREMFYLTKHSTHFIYGYMASDIWLRTILMVRKKTRCRHIGYSYRLTARVLLYAPSHRQDNTYHGLCYTSCGALAGTRNSSIATIQGRSNSFKVSGFNLYSVSFHVFCMSLDQIIFWRHKYGCRFSFTKRSASTYNFDQGTALIWQ